MLERKEHSFDPRHIDERLTINLALKEASNESMKKYDEFGQKAHPQLSECHSWEYEIPDFQHKETPSEKHTVSQSGYILFSLSISLG